MIVRLKAQAPYRNVARFYTLRKSTNLWGEVVVSSSFGRIGTHGNVTHRYFTDTSQAEAYIATTLRKRLNASKRIGCNYQGCSELTPQKRIP